jgi:UDPglucose--hexose-1-phosphate uridylyltransferase
VRHELEPLTQAELDSCPFCEGREDRTPPETFAIGPPGRLPDTPGWSLRVVPNKYPAFAHHEVVIHTPRHVRSFGELTAEEVARVADAWRSRADTARAAGYPHVQALINEGRAAGASLPHTHSQLAWLEEQPPLVAAERTANGGCTLCDLLEAERASGARVVVDAGDVVAIAPSASRSPYELLIAGPHPGSGAFDDAALAAALELTRDTIARIYRVEGPVPLNAWLHDGRHWHFEIVPRLSTPASLELGAGIYINSLAPEEAASRLRGASL